MSIRLTIIVTIQVITKHMVTGGFRQCKFTTFVRFSYNKQQQKWLVSALGTIRKRWFSLLTITVSFITTKTKIR